MKKDAPIDVLCRSTYFRIGNQTKDKFPFLLDVEQKMFQFFQPFFGCHHYFMMGKPKNGRKNWDISCISIKNGMVAKMKVYCITLNVISEERLNYFYTIILKRKIFPTLILTTRLYIYLAICVNDPKENSIKVAIFSSR